MFPVRYAGDGEALMLGHHRVLGNPDKISSVSSVKHLEGNYMNMIRSSLHQFIDIPLNRS